MIAFKQLSLLRPSLRELRPISVIFQQLRTNQQSHFRTVSYCEKSRWMDFKELSLLRLSPRWLRPSSEKEQLWASQKNLSYKNHLLWDIQVNGLQRTESFETFTKSFQIFIINVTPYKMRYWDFPWLKSYPSWHLMLTLRTFFIDFITFAKDLTPSSDLFELNLKSSPLLTGDLDETPE